MPVIQRRTKRRVALRTDARESVIRFLAFDVGCSAFSAKLGGIETTGGTATGRARLRIAVTKAAGKTKALACFASYDLDGDRRYAALDRSWFSHRDLLRFHTVVSTKDATFDCRSVDSSLQQDCSRNCGHAARCPDLGNASDLCCRIPIRLLDLEPAGGAASTLSSVSIARLRALACIFTRYLAHILACFSWFALPGRSFGNNYLFSDAFAH